MDGPLPLSSLRLLAPPLRLMSAVMWKVVHLRSIKHYRKVEEFVSMVTDAIPDLLTDKQMRLLTLGLRAKVTLQMLSSEQPEDLTALQTHLKILLSSSSKQVQRDESVEENFVRLVQRLLEDPKERQHFLKNVFPVEYGPDFDSALETLLCEFITRLEKVLHIPDFKQTAVWIGDKPSVLEECMHCVSRDDDLRVLLRGKACRSEVANKHASNPSHSEQQLFSSLSRPPSPQKTTAKDTESNTETETQRQPETGPLQETADTVVQEFRFLFKEEANSMDSNIAQQITGGLLSDPKGFKLEKNNGISSAPCQAPSTSCQSPGLSDSLIRCPRKRVANKCPHCGKCFIYRYKLLEHQRLHTGENPYKCSQCGKAFRRTSDMSTHRRTQCTNAAYICIKCGESFQTVQEKFRHRCGQSVQSSTVPSAGEAVKKKHLLGKRKVTRTKIRTYTCKQCERVYPSMSELRIHQKIHVTVPSHKCGQCGKFYSSVATLTEHQVRHQEKKTQMCVYCGKAFKTKADLRLHTRTHTGEKPFQCKYCGKRFTVSGGLTVHIRTHTGEKPFLCSDCGKSFVSAGELQSHRRTHTGERPYKCIVCGHGFIMSGQLKAHMQVHTGERPHVCLECGKSFSRGNLLKNHQMYHAGVRPYTCHLCAKAYTCTNHLNRHLKTHSVV